MWRLYHNVVVDHVLAIYLAWNLSVHGIHDDNKYILNAYCLMARDVYAISINSYNVVAVE